MCFLVEVCLAIQGHRARLIQYEIRLQQLSDERFENHLAKESGVNTS
jgi:hypothetical protein